MQKFLFSVFFILLLLGGGVFILFHYLGDIRPALLPTFPSQNVSQSIVDSDKNRINSAGETVPRQAVGFELTIDPGFQVGTFAKDVKGVRDLQFSPEGVLLASAPAQGTVFAFKVDGNSVERRVVVDGLSKPHGLGFYQGKLFIAENNKLARYSWDSTTLETRFEKELLKLRSGSHDAHTIVFDKNGNLYVKIGSSCNVCEETNSQAATIIKTDSEGRNPVIFATGVRNAAFMTLNEETGEIFATENGRDMLGDDIPPEEINIIREGKNYGWPICYGERVHDTAFDKKFYIRNPCEDTEVAFHYMQAHSAPLGLSFIPESFSAEYKGDLLVGFHGSWNRSVPTGYKVVRVDIESGKVVGEVDFLSGFLKGANALGRPVDVEFDTKGNLFVSDDKGGTIFVVSRK